MRRRRSAFDSFCRNAEQGQFPQLSDRESLWRLLMVITLRKAAHLIRDENRQKRGGDASMISQSGDEPTLEQVLSREPNPAFAAQVTEEYERLLVSLGDKELANLALWKMEGFTVDEMAAKLGRAPRSVKRKLQLIRSIWEKEGLV
jgi:DNA-directed RNA polymerase specialized sigma24 family protein